MDKLNELVELSRELGTEDYVKGGGGNGSVKDANTLWIKPSGTTMAGLSPETLVAMDRRRIAAMYDAAPPGEVNAREAWVAQRMREAVRENSSGRPSVEAPLHNLFAARFVLHTHPPAVNGMACSATGAAVCRRLFPDALWMDYVDPGYTLAVAARAAVADYAGRHGREPEIMVLGNHGILVAGETPAAVRGVYGKVMAALNREYAAAGIATSLSVGAAPSPADAERVKATLAAAAGPAVTAVRCCGPFAVAAGPLTPDHIVYMKSVPLITDDPTVEGVRAFMQARGYYPHVVSTPGGVYAFGESEKAAGLALDLARDGALIRRLADAFGGVRYMSDAARAFIENWEVESYRKKQIGA